MRSAGASNANGPPAIARIAAIERGNRREPLQRQRLSAQAVREARRQEEERDDQRRGDEAGAEHFSH